MNVQRLRIFLIASLTIVAFVVPTLSASGAPPRTGQCSDGIDNGGDGLTDFPADPGCSSSADNDERTRTRAQCSDGIDNDSDGLIDLGQDPGCTLAVGQDGVGSRHRDAPTGSTTTGTA